MYIISRVFLRRNPTFVELVNSSEVQYLAIKFDNFENE